ncbi:hypothetical protein BT67DRAFT_9604 [Trichocladium antarcticum]|uniref:Uncharacterized protein n=1 Tax=Trichocladium antarcticum TaxID=1450529 RepID=A0AAN6UTB8_9PEZI|nr:hypothetical protein BT67DRAFT_9604 [Trichocladium antarcticum]
MFGILASWPSGNSCTASRLPVPSFLSKACRANQSLGRGAFPTDRNRAFGVPGCHSRTPPFPPPFPRTNTNVHPVLSGRETSKWSDDKSPNTHSIQDASCGSSFRGLTETKSDLPRARILSCSFPPYLICIAIVPRQRESRDVFRVLKLTAKFQPIDTCIAALPPCLHIPRTLFSVVGRVPVHGSSLHPLLQPWSHRQSVLCYMPPPVLRLERPPSSITLAQPSGFPNPEILSLLASLIRIPPNPGFQISLD